MRKEYNSEYFIKKFKNIPRDRWIVDRFHDRRSGARCALGHCGVLSSRKLTEESNMLEDLFLNALGTAVEDVNDGTYSNIYPGKNPRTRVLNALKAAKRKGY